MLVDKVLAEHLHERETRFCLIGGVAMAAWSVGRFTADVDLLTLDGRVLQKDFWLDSGLPAPTIRTGDAEDPLGGVVRFALDPPHDLILGRGYAARVALENSVRHPGLPCFVADPLGLILLKLEAGAPLDAYDVLGLLSTTAGLGAASLLTLADHLPHLSPEAQAFWHRIQSLRGD